MLFDIASYSKALTDKLNNTESEKLIREFVNKNGAFNPKASEEEQLKWLREYNELPLQIPSFTEEELKGFFIEDYR